jgi:hypothetical protein
MDDLNIHIDELVLDGAAPLSPESLQAALSGEIPGAANESLAPIAVAVADQMRSRIASQPRQPR